MSNTSTLTLPARVSVAALFVLGLLGGTLIVAYSGFATSPRRGGTPIFVPIPEAYVMAAAMYSMSCLAMLVLLRIRNQSWSVSVAAVCLYAVLAWLLLQAIDGLL